MMKAVYGTAGVRIFTMVLEKAQTKFFNDLLLFEYAFLLFKWQVDPKVGGDEVQRN